MQGRAGVRFGATRQREDRDAVVAHVGDPHLPRVHRKAARVVQLVRLAAAAAKLEGEAALAVKDRDPVAPAVRDVDSAQGPSGHAARRRERRAGGGRGRVVEPHRVGLAELAGCDSRRRRLARARRAAVRQPHLPLRLLGPRRSPQAALRLALVVEEPDAAGAVGRNVGNVEPATAEQCEPERARERRRALAADHVHQRAVRRQHAQPVVAVVGDKEAAVGERHGEKGVVKAPRAVRRGRGAERRAVDQVCALRIGGGGLRSGRRNRARRGRPRAAGRAEELLEIYPERHELWLLLRLLPAARTAGPRRRRRRLGGALRHAG